MRTKFKHYPKRPKKLTAKFVSVEYRHLVEKIPSAEASDSPEGWFMLFRGWNSLKSYVSSEAARVSYRYSQDMSNHDAEVAEKYFREKIYPVIEEPEHALINAFLKSKHMSALADKFGEQLPVIYEKELKPSDPVNAGQRVAAGKLAVEYEKTIAKAKISVGGQEMTLWKSRSFMESPDEKLRKEAYLANRTWFLSQHPKLSRLYDELVAIRVKMAANVGYDSYIPYAYEMMGRTGYGPAEAKNFRQNIKKYIVPLARQLADQHAAAMNKKILKPWDGYDPTTSLPLGIVPVKAQLDKAHRMFRRLSPDLAARFNQMRKDGLIDLQNRPNKRSGAYCTDFSDEEKVAIFCNSTGDADDIETLTHEMGHAFQVQESQRIEAIDLHWGTLDLCEVFSTGMEYLIQPYIDEFFEPADAEKFIKGRLAQSIGMFCWVCVVDEFQHFVFEKPEITPRQRDEKWLELIDTYLAPVDYSGYEKYRKLSWYGQSHIFVSPFYYIDYALAEVCALQLADIAKADESRSLETFFKMARLGGTKSFIEAIEYGGLRSPFDENVIKQLAGFLSERLRLKAQ